MITTQVGAAWHIRTPYVYRILPEEYVDEFFDSGKLRISSFNQFSKHDDEDKGDKQEGKYILVGIGTKQTVYAVTSHGSDAFVLCGAQIFNNDLSKRFNSNSAILIKDSTAFGATILRQIAGFKFGMEGPCVYKDGPIECDIGDFELDQLKTDAPDQNLDLNKMGGFLLNMAGSEVFFRKRERYAPHLEYRWIWLTDKKVPDYLEIYAPDARQYCEKVNPEP